MTRPTKHAKGSAILGAGWHLFLYGESAGAAIVAADGSHPTAAPIDGGDQTALAVSYRCLGGAAGSSACNSRRAHAFARR